MYYLCSPKLLIFKRYPNICLDITHCSNAFLNRQPMIDTIQPHSFKAWLLATRPKTLPGALAPVIVGSSLAFHHEHLVWPVAILCSLFAVLMQVVANFINDYTDYKKGSDREDRLGPERACAQGWISPSAMLTASYITSILACFVGLGLLYYGGWPLIIIGLICVLFAFLYSTGPYPLSYYGWGDVLVIVFFGLIPVVTTYYIMCKEISGYSILLGFAVGIATDAILMVNNYRDIAQDQLSKKRTIVVRFGASFGAKAYAGIGLLASLLTAVYFCLDMHPLYILALLPYGIIFTNNYRQLKHIGPNKRLNIILGKTALSVLVLSLTLAICTIIFNIT